MINTLNPGAAGPQDQKGEVLRKISEQYGPAEERRKDPVKKLGKDEFFKLMVTQMQHQDPMKPASHEQMAAQLAQFSALEQMQNVNQNLEKLSAAQLPTQQMGAASLIGKYVTADGSRIFHTEGQKSAIKFELAGDAAKLRVAILNEKGENIKEFDAGEKSKGDVTIDWNGKNERNLNAPAGNYMVQVFAEGGNGQTVPVKMQKTEIVSGVSFQGKETILLVGDPQNPHKMFLKNVSKIVDANQAASARNATSEGENPFAEMLKAQGIAPVVPSYELEEPFTESAVDFKPGQAAKYSPVDFGGKPVSTTELDPAATGFSGLLKSPAKSSAGQSVQASQDGSAAGNLIE